MADNKLQASEKSSKEKWDAFGMGVFLVVLGAGTLLASWLLLQQASKNHVIYEISTAAREGELYKLTKAMDWNSVRESLKEELKQKANPHNGLPTRAEEVDALVDYYVRPQNLETLVTLYHSSPAKNMNPESFIRGVRFSGITEMTIELASPPQFDKPWMNYLEPVRAVFALDGMTWKLKRISAPDYLIPTRMPASYKQVSNNL